MAKPETAAPKTPEEKRIREQKKELRALRDEMKTLRERRPVVAERIKQLTTALGIVPKAKSGAEG